MKSNFFKLRTIDLAQIGLLTAILCILGPLSIALPFTGVPISLTNFGIYLLAAVFGWKKGGISCLLYILLGIVGLPVFSGFRGGLSVFVGTTGGYLVGFILMAFITGFFYETFKKFYVQFIGMILGTAITYILGTLWLMKVADLSFLTAITAGVIPFLLFDVIKMVLAAITAPTIRKFLLKTNLLH